MSGSYNFIDIYKFKKIMQEQKNDTLFVDKDGFVSVEDWCVYNRISVRKFYSVLRKNTDTKFVSNAGVDMALKTALDELKTSQFQKNLENKKNRTSKLKNVAELKSLGYNLVKQALKTSPTLKKEDLAVAVTKGTGEVVKLLNTTMPNQVGAGNSGTSSVP